MVVERWFWVVERWFWVVLVVFRYLAKTTKTTEGKCSVVRQKPWYIGETTNTTKTTEHNYLEGEEAI